jgi:anti-sigma factor RsiW
VRCPYRSSLGAFLLDALEPAERDAMERHLAGCASCRRELERMAALPALLAIVPVREAHMLTPEVPPGRILAGAGAPAPRRTINAAVWLALVVVLGVGALLGRSALDETVRAADRGTGVRMTAEIARLPWGAGVQMRLAGVAPGERCRLVVAAGRRREVAAHWQATYAGDAAAYATTSIPAAEVDQLAVITDDGRVLLRAPVH